MSTYQRAIRTESAAISTARQSLDNVLSAKANLEQQSSSPDNSADRHYALEFQIAELEGMLTEVMDERFARTVDESQPDDENRNVGLLNFITDTANNILASLSPTSNTPPPTYEKNHINTQSTHRKPKAESRNSSFPLPHDQRNSKRKSTHAAAPSIRSTPTNNSRLTGSSKPLPSPFQSGNTDSSLDDLSLSAFQALKTSDAFKTLLDRAESKQTNEIDRDNLSLKEVFGNNVSKELRCAFDVLIRISSFERSSKDTTHSRRVSSDEPTPRFNNKGKAPLRSGVPPNTSGTPSSSSVSSDSDFVTIDKTQSPPHNNNNNNDANSTTTTTTTTATSSSQPPPYSQHILPTTPKTQNTPSSLCVNCGFNARSHHETGLEIATCGHKYCPACTAQLLDTYFHDGISLHPLRCRCNERIRNGVVERFILTCNRYGGQEGDGERKRLVLWFREKYDEYENARFCSSSGRL